MANEPTRQVKKTPIREKEQPVMSTTNTNNIFEALRADEAGHEYAQTTRDCKNDRDLRTLGWSRSSLFAL